MMDWLADVGLHLDCSFVGANYAKPMKQFKIDTYGLSIIGVKKSTH